MANISIHKLLLLFLFERSEFLIATSPPKNLCVCSTNLGFSVGYVLCTRYVCTWYQPATQIRMYLVSAGRRTFRPWTYTSDDSYMYQLSLVVSTANVSYICLADVELWRCWWLQPGRIVELASGGQYTHRQSVPPP